MPRFGPSAGLGQGRRFGGEFTPRALGAKLALWLNADMGVTLFGAQNLLRHSEALAQTAAWFYANVTVTGDPSGMWRVVDDSANGIHCAAQNLTSVLTAGQAATFEVDVAAGTCTDGIIAVNGGAGAVYMSFATGEVQGVAGCTLNSITDRGVLNGVRVFRVSVSFTYNAGTDIRIYVNGAGAGVYAGTGKYVLVNRAWVRSDPNATYIMTGATPITSSSSVVAWADQSGNGRHALQSTVAEQPVYLASDPAFGGRASIALDGLDDFLAIATAGITNPIVGGYMIAASMVPGVQGPGQAAWYSNRGVFTDAHAASLESDVFLGVNNDSGAGGVAFSYLTHSVSFPAQNAGSLITKDVAHVHAFRSLSSGVTEHYVDAKTLKGSSEQGQYRTKLGVGNIGFDAGGTNNYYSGRLRDVVLVAGDVTNADRDQVLAFIAANAARELAA